MTLSWEELESAIQQNDANTINRRSPGVQLRYSMRHNLSRIDLEQVVFRNSDFAVTRNRYPYDVDTQHYLLWCRRRITLADARCKVSALTIKPFLIYENPPSHRSVGHTQHFHVFTRDSALV